MFALHIFKPRLRETEPKNLPIIIIIHNGFKLYNDTGLPSGQFRANRMGTLRYNGHEISHHDRARGWAKASDYS